MATKALILSSALVLGATAAQAASYNVVQIPSQALLCRNVQAATHKAAYIKCIASLGVSIPADKAIVTTAPSCRSTHRIQPQNQPGATARWAYDIRFFRPTPDCP